MENMENQIFYRLADGQIWDVQHAAWLLPNEAEELEAAQITSAAIESQDTDAILENPEQGADQGGIIDLVSAEGNSDVEYLAKTLAFYDYPLGELVMYSAKGIKEELQRLDNEYLTPRTLAGLATGDQYAIAQWQEHETKAAPLRQRLEELESE